MAQPRTVNRRALRVTGALLGAGVLVAPLTVSASAMPSQADREAAQSAVVSQEGRIGILESQLAAADSRLEGAEIEASIAAEAYNTAQVEADEAQKDYDSAAEEKETADAELERSLDDFAAMALDSYRSGGALASAQVWVGADGFEDVLRRTAAYEVASVQIDDAVADSDAAQKRADRATAEADRTKKVLDDRLARADEAAQEAEVAVADALAAQSALDTLMSSAVVELAALRATSVDVERRYQEGLLEQRRQQEAEAQAAEQARLNASRAAAGSAAPKGSSAASGPAEGAPAPAPAESKAPAPAPAESKAPAPAESTAPAPAPEPTKTEAPAPEPTKTEAPAPKPSPTKTEAPAPKPSPTPTPTPKPAPPAPAPPASRTGQAFVDKALSQVGKPYVLGAAGPDSYDCSGLVQWSLKQLGVSIPRTSKQQWEATTRVSKDDLQPGDLIFYSNNGSGSGVYHVAIYTGPGMRVHAPSPGKSVEHVKIWDNNVLGYGRVL